MALAPSATGASVGGTPVTLLNQDQVWESTMENPAMVQEGGQYVLLFSGGLYDTAGYATGYAKGTHARVRTSIAHRARPR